MQQREIKFRAWDRDNKEMFFVAKMTFRTDNDVFRIWGDKHFKEDIFHIVNPADCELMQYTGLKDKNGKEIYEGDIVKKVTGVYEISITPLGTQIGKYLVSYGVTGQDEFDENYTLENFRIIGNIYENPELLKQKTN